MTSLVPASFACSPALGLVLPACGTDIPLANAVAREVITAGLVNEELVARATTGYDQYRASVEPWTLEEAERVTGVPATAIRELAHAWGNSKFPQMCWTLGITEHHNAVDNVFALINLSLLVGGVAATVRDCSRCVARTTCRAAATWVRSRTSSPASRTSRPTRRARS